MYLLRRHALGAASTGGWGDGQNARPTNGDGWAQPARVAHGWADDQGVAWCVSGACLPGRGAGCAPALRRGDGVDGWMPVRRMAAGGRSRRMPPKDVCMTRGGLVRVWCGSAGSGHRLRPCAATGGWGGWVDARSANGGVRAWRCVGWDGALAAPVRGDGGMGGLSHACPVAIGSRVVVIGAYAIARRILCIVMRWALFHHIADLLSGDLRPDHDAAVELGLEDGDPGDVAAIGAGQGGVEPVG